MRARRANYREIRKLAPRAGFAFLASCNNPLLAGITIILKKLGCRGLISSSPNACV